MADKSHELKSSVHGTVKPRGRVALRGIDYYAPYWWSVLPTIATGIVAWQLPLEHTAICDQPSERARWRKAWGWLHPTISRLSRSTETSDFSGSARSATLLDPSAVDGVDGDAGFEAAPIDGGGANPAADRTDGSPAPRLEGWFGADVSAAHIGGRR